MRPLLILGLLATTGCGGGTTPTPDPTEEDKIFIALERDFQAFPRWERFHLEGDGSSTPHFGGVRDIYLNSRPAKGAKQFPVGTIIVKHTDGVGDPDNGGPRTFAMVKRGGDYNKDGALNWEWFELVQSDPTVATSPWQIAWRGLGPSAGGAYGTTDGSCNGCHAQGSANDYVQADALLRRRSGRRAALATTAGTCCRR
ncbi:MAG: hypothetical protein ACXU86_00675, partial [Archangium sp.]